MKTSIYIVTLTLILYFICTIKVEDENIDCTSAFSIVNNNRILSLSITLSIYNGNGLITFIGNSGGAEDNIIIKKYFSYDKNKNDVYVFKSNDSTVRLPPLSVEESFDNFLPPFFTGSKKENEFIVKIIKIKNGTWIFMSTDTPYFICESSSSSK